MREVLSLYMVLGSLLSYRTRFWDLVTYCTFSYNNIELNPSHTCAKGDEVLSDQCRLRLEGTICCLSLFFFLSISLIAFEVLCQSPGEIEFFLTTEITIL